MTYGILAHYQTGFGYKLQSYKQTTFRFDINKLQSLDVYRGPYKEVTFILTITLLNVDRFQ